jgi:hypothetical protein
VFAGQRGGASHRRSGPGTAALLQGARRVAALTSDTTSADVAAPITEVNTALLTAIDAAGRERIRSFDPTIVDPQKARQWHTEAEFVRDRLQAALAALQERR